MLVNWVYNEYVLLWHLPQASEGRWLMLSALWHPASVASPLLCREQPHGIGIICVFLQEQAGGLYSKEVVLTKQAGGWPLVP